MSVCPPCMVPVLSSGTSLLQGEGKEGCRGEREAGSAKRMAPLCAQAAIWPGDLLSLPRVSLQPLDPIAVQSREQDRPSLTHPGQWEHARRQLIHFIF